MTQRAARYPYKKRYVTFTAVRTEAAVSRQPVAADSVRTTRMHACASPSPGYQLVTGARDKRALGRQSAQLRAHLIDVVAAARGKGRPHRSAARAAAPRYATNAHIDVQAGAAALVRDPRSEDFKARLTGAS